jgi:DNA-binding NarL/FixJ family response regulator
MDRAVDSITVLLVEDHFLARIALRSVLAGHPQIRVIGEAGDGEQGLTMYRAGHERIRSVNSCAAGVRRCAGGRIVELSGE